MPEMIVLSTDFGLEGPYVGQVKGVLYRQAPNCDIIDLFSDLPRFNPNASAALLAAYSRNFPDGSVFLSIVDPGVGMPERLGIVVKANGYWFVGPGNGLFDLVLQQDSRAQCWEITWQPDSLSDSEIYLHPSQLSWHWINSQKINCRFCQHMTTLQLVLTILISHMSITLET